MFGRMPQHLVFGPELWPFDRCEDYVQEEASRRMPVVFEKDTTSFKETQHAAATVQKRLMNELDVLLTTDIALARDLAYFGDSERTVNQILEAYHLTPEELTERMEDKDFRLLVKTMRKDMEKDVNGMVRARAKMMLDAELDMVHEAVMNRAEPLRDRLNGFKLMATLADAMPRNESGGMQIGTPTGPAANVTINIGSNSPYAGQLSRVFEGKAEQVEDTDG